MSEREREREREIAGERESYRDRDAIKAGLRRPGGLYPHKVDRCVLASSSCRDLRGDAGTQGRPMAGFRGWPSLLGVVHNYRHL